MPTAAPAAPDAAPTRVLVVDDQALIRAGFRAMLAPHPDIRVVGEACDGREAVQAAERWAPDVVLMDVRMPVLNGIEATRRIVARTGSRVLVLTSFDLDDHAYDALRAGASGFLLKDVLPEALHEAILAVAAGDAVLTPRITRDLVDRFARHAMLSPPVADPEDALRALTPRERETFALVATGLTNSEIARRMHLTEATVKSHVTRLLTKLQLRDRVQVVIFAYERGLQ